MPVTILVCWSRGELQQWNTVVSIEGRVQLWYGKHKGTLIAHTSISRNPRACDLEVFMINIQKKSCLDKLQL